MNRFRRIVYAAACIVYGALLIGCSTTTTTKDKTADWSAERLYEEAKRMSSSGRNLQAIDHLDNLESRFPFDPLAQQAILDRGYAYYKYGSPDEAMAEFSRFIRLYPAHPYVDYAFYMHGVIRHEQEKSFFDKYITDPAERDTEALRQAFSAFHTVIEKFPNSKYAKDAAQRMITIRETLARHEILVAYYYTHRQAHIAAVNRAAYVLEHYRNAEIIPEALALLVYNYDKMTLPEKADDVRRVLQLNYPDYEMQYTPNAKLSYQEPSVSE